MGTKRPWIVEVDHSRVMEGYYRWSTFSTEAAAISEVENHYLSAHRVGQPGSVWRGVQVRHRGTREPTKGWGSLAKAPTTPDPKTAPSGGPTSPTTIRRRSPDEVKTLAMTRLRVSVATLTQGIGCEPVPTSDILAALAEAGVLAVEATPEVMAVLGSAADPEASFGDTLKAIAAMNRVPLWPPAHLSSKTCSEAAVSGLDTVDAWDRVRLECRWMLDPSDPWEESFWTPDKPARVDGVTVSPLVRYRTQVKDRPALCYRLVDRQTGEVLWPTTSGS